jgi:hypothetical protein
LENPNVLITAFPLVLVPLYAVPLSILLHLTALKRLKVEVGASSDKEFTCGGRSRHWVSHLPHPLLNKEGLGEGSPAG